MEIQKQPIQNSHIGIDVDAAASLVVQLSESELRLLIALVCEELVVLNEVVVELRVLVTRVLSFVEKSDALHSRASRELHVFRH